MEKGLVAGPLVVEETFCGVEDDFTAGVLVEETFGEVVEEVFLLVDDRVMVEVE